MAVRQKQNHILILSLISTHTDKREKQNQILMAEHNKSGPTRTWDICYVQQLKSDFVFPFCLCVEIGLKIKICFHFCLTAIIILLSLYE